MKLFGRSHPIRIGQVVPSVNVTMEEELGAMLRMRESVRPERFCLHSSRTRLKDGVKEELKGLDRDSERCVLELTDARVDIVSYSSFAALIGMGIGYHRVCQQRLHRHTAEAARPISTVTSVGHWSTPCMRPG